MSAAHGDILVFADARQRFSTLGTGRVGFELRRSALSEVSQGELILDCEGPSQSDSSVGDGVGLYWRYEEVAPAQRERRVVDAGSNGRHLCAPAYAVGARFRPRGRSLTMSLAPMRAVLSGYRIVFEDRARAFDKGMRRMQQAENRRKTRTLAGNYQMPAAGVAVARAGHQPCVAPVLLPQGRPAPGAVGPGLLAFVSNMFIASRSWYYATALTVQVGFYGLAVVGGLVEKRGSRRRGEFENMSFPLEKGAR